MAKRVVIAVGGNVILQTHQAPTFEAQLRNVQVTAAQIAKVEAMDYEIVLTHGNGPQVGNVLQQNDIAKDVVPPFPLDACNSETQGSIGYMLEQSLKNALNRQKSSGYNPLKGNKYETQDLLSLGGFLFAKLFDTRSAIFSKLLSGFGSFDQGFR